jgi:hypothetical protein
MSEFLTHQGNSEFQLQSTAVLKKFQTDVFEVGRRCIDELEFTARQVYCIGRS